MTGCRFVSSTVPTVNFSSSFFFPLVPKPGTNISFKRGWTLNGPDRWFYLAAPDFSPKIPFCFQNRISRGRLNSFWRLLNRIDPIDRRTTTILSIRDGPVFGPEAHKTDKRLHEWNGCRWSEPWLSDFPNSAGNSLDKTGSWCWSFLCVVSMFFSKNHVKL